MTHEHIVAGIAAALQAGAMTPDVVAVEARRAAQVDTASAVDLGPKRSYPQVTSLTERRLAALPPDTRPLPSVAAYDQLLRRQRPPPDEPPEDLPGGKNCRE
ncbi:hypothetical protein AB0D27_33800 [Streptomyces sp. NPDC048415]|uniref:hypothetical protein n=1 Tax=Streptomyces sp. NPDC048415 TaxID=3154822 RepID=UPI003436E3F2